MQEELAVIFHSYFDELAYGAAHLEVPVVVISKPLALEEIDSHKASRNSLGDDQALLHWLLLQDGGSVEHVEVVIVLGVVVVVQVRHMSIL